MCICLFARRQTQNRFNICFEGVVRHSEISLVHVILYTCSIHMAERCHQTPLLGVAAAINMSRRTITGCIVILQSIPQHRPGMSTIQVYMFFCLSSYGETCAKVKFTSYLWAFVISVNVLCLKCNRRDRSTNLVGYTLRKWYIAECSFDGLNMLDFFPVLP